MLITFQIKIKEAIQLITYLNTSSNVRKIQYNRLFKKSVIYRQMLWIQMRNCWQLGIYFTHPTVWLTATRHWSLVLNQCRLGTQAPRSYYSLFTKSTKNSKCCFVYFVQFVTYLLLQTFSFFRCYFQFLNLKQDSRTTEKKEIFLVVVALRSCPHFQTETWVTAIPRIELHKITNLQRSPLPQWPLWNLFYE